MKDVNLAGIVKDIRAGYLLIYSMMTRALKLGLDLLGINTVKQM